MSSAEERIRYNIKELEQMTLIELSGELDMYTCPKVKVVIFRLIESGKFNLILELSKVEYVDSTFIGLINEVLKKCKDHEGALKILNPCSYLKRIIDVMHLDYFHDIYDNEEIAIESFKENITKAVLKWKEVVKLQPKYADAHYHLAVSMKNNGSLDDALIELQKAVDINPKYAKVYKIMGDIYYIKKQKELALESYQNAINIDPDFLEAFIGIGKCSENNEMLDNVISKFEDILKNNSSYADIHNNLGTAYLAKNELEEAVKCFEEAIKINNGYINAHNNLAETYKKMNKIEKAAEIYKKVISISSSDHDKERAHKEIKLLKRAVLKKED